MTQISVWGPITWFFFHTLAEKVRESEYNNVKHNILNVLKQFCKFLPCEDCAGHATQIMNTVTIDKINTKEQLKNFLFNFHNSVTVRTKKTPFDKSILDKYKTANLHTITTKLFQVFHTHDKKYMMNEFNRNMMLKNIKHCLIEIFKCCDP